jgi:hypothetical protein
MKQLYILIGFACATASLSAQNNFSRFYGTQRCDDPIAVTTTATGGYAMGGYTMAHASTGNFLLVITDAAADTLKTMEYDSGYPDYMYDMKRTTDSGYIMTGVSFTPGGAELLLIKTDAAGAVVWSNIYNGTANTNTYPEEVIQTSDGGFAVTGSSSPFFAFTLKVDANGVVQWMNRYMTNGNSLLLRTLTETANGDIVAVGQLSTPAPAPLFVVRINAAGTLLWSRQIVTPSLFTPNAVIEHSNGSLYVAGTSYASASSEMFLMSLNSTGAVQFTQRYAVTQFGAAANDLIELPGGDMCIAGSLSGTSGSFAVAVALSPAGNAGPAINYQPAGYHSWFVGAAVTSDSGIVFLAGVDFAFNVHDTASFNLVKANMDLSSTCLNATYPVIASASICSDTLQLVQVMTTSVSAPQPLTHAAGLDVVNICFSNAIAEEQAALTPAVYPNPAGDMFTLSTDPSLPGAHTFFTLYNTAGQVVMQRPVLSERETIRCGELAPGLYYYTVSNEAGVHNSGRLVKQE